MALCSGCGMVEHGGPCPPPDPSRCPVCWRTEDVGNTGLKWWDVFTLPLLLWPYECRCCRERFYGNYWRFW